MQLKEFSFIFPVLESTEVFKAIGTVIPPDVIAQTIGNTDSLEERKRKLPFPTSSMFGDRHESVVVGFNQLVAGFPKSGAEILNNKVQWSIQRGKKICLAMFL